MTAKTPKRLTINVSPDFRDALKIQAIAHGKTLKDYVTEALMDRLLQDSAEEDKVWSEMSDAAKKEDILSAEDSESLLVRMKNA
jgi:plasmid stability protein